MEKSVLEGVPTPVVEYISNLENKIEALSTQVDKLTELLVLAQKSRFGSSSEKIKYILSEDYAQDTLFNEAEVCADEDAPEPVIIEQHTRKPKRTKEELAKDLPVKEVIIDLPEDERVCNICEGDIHAIGREFVRRELEFIPAQAYVTDTYRVNYSCKDCKAETDEANIIKPAVPVAVVKRGLASPSSAAHVMYQKFVNAMPLNRQSKDWETFGVKISRATLANWIIYTSDHWLLPLWSSWKDELLKSPVIHADETTIQVLKEHGKTPQSKSQMWVYCTGRASGSPPIVLFEYQTGRSGDHPKAFLKGVKDIYLHSDGYSGYNAVDNVIHCGCWAHQRRKFEEAMPKNAPKENNARKGLEFCQQLFALEKSFADLTPEERLEKRIEQSKPVLDAYYDWIENRKPLAGAKFGAALVYAVNQKRQLSAFLLDGRVEISNNRVENMIRPFTLGRKNWMFADTPRGAKASAVAYSVIETAKANGLNPYQYLLYLFTTLPTVLTKNPLVELSSFYPWAGEVQEKCQFAQDVKGQFTLLG